MSGVPYVIIGADEYNDPPWGHDRTCPTCGQPDLPLQASTSDTGRITVHFISHCGGTWMRGPIDVQEVER